MTGQGPARPAAPIESKVKWSTAGAYFGAMVGTYALELIAGDPVIITPMPDWLEPIVLSLIPAGVAFLAGVRAKHTPRPDLPYGDELGKR